MPEDIEEVEFTIFDTETTGLSVDAGDRVVELAALRVKGSQRLAVFDALVKTDKDISPGAFAVNKITPKMLENAAPAEIVMPKFLDFIQGSCLCSYNAGFDLSFLNNEFKLIGFCPVNRMIVFDVLDMAKKLVPSLPRYALWFVARHLGVAFKQKHRALSDVEMAWEVFTKLKIICAQKGINSFADFSKNFAFKPKTIINNNK